jgi:hypothetical protein
MWQHVSCNEHHIYAPGFVNLLYTLQSQHELHELLHL